MNTPLRRALWAASGGACLLALLALPLQAQQAPAKAPTDLAARVKKIFTDNCHDCHGAGGAAEANLYILTYRSLIGRIIPKSADESDVFNVVWTDGGKRTHRMPKDGDALSEADQKAIQDWINAGAPDFNPPAGDRSFIPPSQVFEAIQRHLRKLPEDDRLYARYFTLTHLYNAGFSDEQLTTYRGALSKLVNSLSRGNSIVKPEPIDPAATILHIDLRKYLWDDQIWQRVAARDPYRVRLGLDSPAATYCIQKTGINAETDAVFVRGDWFVFAASRPPCITTSSGSPAPSPNCRRS